MKKFLLVLFSLMAIAGAFGVWFLGVLNSNPFNYKHIGDIQTPLDYKRVEYSDDSFASYLRSLPLKSCGSRVQLYTGGHASFQSLNYAVVDMPLFSNDEQCADVCMRLRAEYLYYKCAFDEIHFNSVNGVRLGFAGGNRKAFERYMRKVYGVANTFSLSRELPVRDLKDIEPGDVFVYAAVDRGKMHKYGHALMVVDVAINDDGEKVFMVVEGNTPAREMHVVRNWYNPMKSPWITLDEDASEIWISPFRYNSNELHFFN